DHRLVIFDPDLVTASQKFPMQVVPVKQFVSEYHFVQSHLKQSYLDEKEQPDETVDPEPHKPPKPVASHSLDQLSNDGDHRHNDRYRQYYTHCNTPQVIK